MSDQPLEVLAEEARCRAAVLERSIVRHLQSLFACNRTNYTVVSSIRAEGKIVQDFDQAMEEYGVLLRRLLEDKESIVRLKEDEVLLAVSNVSLLPSPLVRKDNLNHAKHLADLVGSLLTAEGVMMAAEAAYQAHLRRVEAFT